MYKFFSAVLLILTVQSVQANELLDQLRPTHELVKAKLWYEGLSPTDVKTDTYAKGQAVKELPEELTVALDKLDS